MSQQQDCPNRVGEVTCENDVCPKGCVRNYRDQPTNDVAMATYKDASPAETPGERKRKTNWFYRLLSRF